MLNSKKISVGITTFLYTNYGALLQAYALQKHLKKYNILDVTNINFRTDWHEKQARVFNLYGSIKSKFSQFVFTLIRYNGLKKRKQRTEKFKKDYFSLTPVYRTVDEFISNPPTMDIYITGSDQVFNPNGEYKDVFYLKFNKGEAKKIAYAPSFGVSDLSEDLSIKIAPLINDFDALSCREKEGATYLSNITGKVVPWLVDPTFLLSAEEWEHILISPKIKDKYIFIYALTGEEHMINIARKIKKNTGYKIICLRGNRKSFFSIDKFIYGSGPAEFIGWIRNAEYVVTDSFHGTIFSVLFDKPFYTFISRPKVSSRIYNLIDLLNIPNCIITHESIKTFSHSSKSYIVNKDKLNEMIQQSINFIQMNIIDDNI